jgi:hypothetical protein
MMIMNNDLTLQTKQDFTSIKDLLYRLNGTLQVLKNYFTNYTNFINSCIK